VEERIAVPADIGEIRSRDARHAREVQLHVSRQFERCFARNLAVIGFDRSAEAGTYLLGPWPSD
jgi:hypothetical protein